MDPSQCDYSQCDYPPMKDLTIDNITTNVNIVNSGAKNPRLKFLMEKLVNHLHDYARETRLSMTEWQFAMDFLAACGQKCTPLRQEFVLLSDVLGLSLLVDAVDHPKPEGATEGTVLGPFFTEDAKEVTNGDGIGSDPDGTPLLVHCTVKDTNGQPVEGMRVDVWETDSKGFYDVQYSNRDGPHGRGILHTNPEGLFWFNAIVPVSYPVPVDGPVGDLLRAMSRHPYRPAHVHFMFEKPGFDRYITALTVRGDPYEFHDPVFGVKKSLVVDIGEVSENSMAQKCGVPVGTKLLQYDFVVITANEAHELRARNAVAKLGNGGKQVKFYEQMPYVDVD